MVEHDRKGNENMNEGPGIASALLDVAKTTGTVVSVCRAQRWQNMLREMAVIANEEQLEAVNRLLAALDMHLDVMDDVVSDLNAAAHSQFKSGGA